MSDHVQKHFVIPLLAQFRLDAPDEQAFLSAVRRELDGATVYQLQRAVERILRTRKHRTWPSIAECVEAVEASPQAEPRRIEGGPIARPASGRPPILIAAERYIAEYEDCGPSEQRMMVQRRPGHLDACRRVVDAWSRPDPGHKTMQDVSRADLFAMRRA